MKSVKNLINVEEMIISLEKIDGILKKLRKVLKNGTL